MKYSARLLIFIFTSLLLANNGWSQSSNALTPALSEEIPPKEANNLSIARQLFKAGALQLALDHLNANPPLVATAHVWQAWAEQKWSIFIQLGDWEALERDAAGLPGSFGASKNFAVVYQARAMIALDKLDAARQLLQPAVQIKDIPLRLQKAIRQQLISLYQAQGDYSNAKIEAIRFHDEFKPQDAAWFIQRAVIEYLAGDVRNASQLLAAIAAIEAKLLQILFRFESHEIDRDKAQMLIKQQIQRKRITATELKLAYGIQAKISATGVALQHRLLEVTALEHYLVANEMDIHPRIIYFDSNHLKHRYLLLAEAIMNEMMQVTTENELAQTLAQRAEDTGEILQARALYVEVMLNSHDAALSASARRALLNNLINADQMKLLVSLFGAQKEFGSFAEIDSDISAKILNYALSMGDAGLIAEIAPILSAPPKNVNQRDWVLQKARIDIFAGRFEQAKIKLLDWLDQSAVLSGEQVDRVLQAVFDLQAVQQDDLSLELFDLISAQTQSKRHKREILFWKAQSFDAKGQRKQAAQHYLRSALEQANGYDQWGHSARYHAASTLMEAGDYIDAKRLFEDLLTVTTDASRRGTIKQALQRLWLLENSATSN